MAEAHLFGMYGMWGPITDFGESRFLGRCKAKIPELQIHGPYRDYDVAAIVSRMRVLPLDATVFIQGTSLGANNVPIVASRFARPVHGVFGFQASQWGAHSSIPKNVLFAHLIYSENPLNFSLGSYVWQTDKDFKGGYVCTRVDDVHPGDGNLNSQKMFIQEIRRIIAKPTG
jgi:hypothetical protein